MLLTKEVEVKPNGSMINYYKEKGYENVKHLQPLIVKVDDLPKRSMVKVDVLCDMCKKTYLQSLILIIIFQLKTLVIMFVWNVVIRKLKK